MLAWLVNNNQIHGKNGTLGQRKATIKLQIGTRLVVAKAGLVLLAICQYYHYKYEQLNGTTS